MARGAPFLVSFSDQWAITNYDQMISLLRYFDRPEWVDSLRKASPEERPAVWRRFYKSTDPVSLTPENEALDRYFRRIQVANQRYQEAGDPGWLTDRGEVFVTLGDPDDVFDFSADVTRTPVRVTSALKSKTSSGSPRVTNTSPDPILPGPNRFWPL